MIQRRISISGERLTDAAMVFDPQTGEPAVTTRFDSVGTRQLADMSKENVNRRFAIKLDNQVISSPYFREPILGGQAQISGKHEHPAGQPAGHAAARRRRLPAPLHVIQERTVGAELGADSITAGRLSAIAGLGLVALFMILRYGLFGLFANIAMFFNLVLLLAALTPLATLTLPGIAGIVLTLGMAVDANVLINERIREEQRNGRGMLASHRPGFPPRPRHHHRRQR